MRVNDINDEEYVQCETDHLSSFTMVVLQAEVMINMLIIEDYHHDCFLWVMQIINFQFFDSVCFVGRRTTLL